MTYTVKSNTVKWKIWIMMAYLITIFKVMNTHRKQVPLIFLPVYQIQMKLNCDRIPRIFLGQSLFQMCISFP